MHDAALIAVNVLQNVVDKLELSETIFYSEVHDDYSIRRCPLQSKVLACDWFGCLRSGEVLVALLHASSNIKSILTQLGCPLLPLQEGSEQMDWLRLRSRFIGNWRNLQNVMRYTKKKCPKLRLQKIDSNTAESIVDCVDPQRSLGHALAILTQYLVLLHAEGILQPDMTQVDLQASDYDDSVNQPSLIYHLQQQNDQQMFQLQQDHQPLDVNNSANTPQIRHRSRNRNNTKLLQHQQPKLNRLNGAKRVICVYDTTTEEDTMKSAVAVPAVVKSNADGESTTGGPFCVLRFSIENLKKMFNSLDEIRSLLVAAIETKVSESGGIKLRTGVQLQNPPQRLQPLPSLSLPQPNLSSTVLTPLELRSPRQQSRHQRQSDSNPRDVRRDLRHSKRRQSLQSPESDSESGSASTAAAGVSGDNQLSGDASKGTMPIAKCGLGQAKPSRRGGKFQQPAGTAAAACMTAKPMMQVSAAVVHPPSPTLHRRRRLNTAKADNGCNGMNFPRCNDDDNCSNSDNDNVGSSTHRGKRRTTTQTAVATASATSTRRARRRKSSTPASSTRVQCATPTDSGPRRRHLPRRSSSATAMAAAVAPANALNAGNDNAGRRSVKLESAVSVATQGTKSLDENWNTSGKPISNSTIQDLILRLQAVMCEDKS